MLKFLLLITVVVAVTVEAEHEPCRVHADCKAHACPNHPGQFGACEFEHKHDHFGACHCSSDHVHLCDDDAGCAGLPCQSGYSLRCSLRDDHDHEPQYCLCDY